MTARFYIEHLDTLQGEVHLPREEAHHLSRVLRLQVNDPVVLFDRDGKQYSAKIKQVTSSSATLLIEAEIANQRTPARDVTVAISPLRPEAMSDLVAKLTELGVAQLATFTSARTALPKAGDRDADEQRRNRWQRVSLAACKQSGRPTPIAIQPVCTFQEMLLNKTAARSFIAWEAGTARPLIEKLQSRTMDKDANAPVLLIIGPEGGFTEEEVDLALQSGCEAVDLGPYILRAETAAVVAAAITLNV